LLCFAPALRQGVVAAGAGPSNGNPCLSDDHRKFIDNRLPFGPLLLLVAVVGA
jgi:hypothetical protein